MAPIASFDLRWSTTGPAVVAEEPAYLRNLRALGKADPTIQVLEDLEKELYANPSDRAVLCSRTIFHFHDEFKEEISDAKGLGF